jgi:hypothetical protein
MAKTGRHTGPSHGTGRQHPGYGEQMHATVHPADGTMSPPVSNEPADGQAPGDPVETTADTAETAKPKPSLSRGKPAEGG